MRCDVLVAGGGAAGLSAAISAARSGAKTILLEELGTLGGTATASLVHSICGLFKLSKSQPEWANQGFAKEFATRLISKNGASGPVRMGRVDVLLTQPSLMACLADEMIQETKNLTVLFHSKLIRATQDLRELEINCRGASYQIAPQAVIDATGDGSVASLCGAAFEMESAETLQRPAFIFEMQNVDSEALGDNARLKISREIVVGIRAGKLPTGCLGASFRKNFSSNGAFVSIDLSGSEHYQPLDPVCLSKLELEGRSTAQALVEYFQKTIDGFQHASISQFPARIGIRESRRIVGKARLETSDLENGSTFSDSVALATWPMELRETASGPRLRYPKNDQPCEIPLGALQARDHENLFMAGRCISCSHEAQASIRVIGTCLATGAAAGIAAANSL